MASFFQPAVYDPNANTTVPSSAVAPGRFLIYTNSTLIGQGIFQYWYQYVVVAIGATAVVLPVIHWLLGGAWSALKRRRKRKYAKLEDVGPDDIPEDLEPPLAYTQDGSRVNLGKKLQLTSFGMFLRGDVQSFLATEYDMHLIDLETCSRGLPGVKEEAHADLGVQGSSSRNVWGLVDDIDWKSISANRPTTMQTVDRFRLIKKSQKLSGLVLSAAIEESKLNEILHILVDSDIPCMILDDASEPHAKVEPGLVCGVIYKNACILPNGSRRDFFQAAKLRSSLARYEQESKAQPNFFIGFLDLWASRPLPAIIRRSYKFAKFHGAILHHEAAGGVQHQQMDTASWGNAWSAFDWLKRADVVKAQKMWREAIKPVDFDGEDQSFVSSLDLTEVEHLIPGIRYSFDLHSVEDQVELLPELHSGRYEPPSYVEKAPPRENIWTTSSQGQPLCEFGCYDLREELFMPQYDAIVSSQQHLNKLGMLEDLSEKDLKLICTTISKSTFLSPEAKKTLSGLAAGLLSQQVKIFRGLDSGFCLPENRGHFWAVSDLNEEGELNIYVSLKVPDFVTTVIHTYLAYKGISRRDRFDIEILLLSDASNQPLLHPRIAHELESATYSELLSMLEQVVVSQSYDPILEAVGEQCERLLIDEASNSAWNELHSHDFLAKRVLIDEVLTFRLRHFAKRGSQFLPLLGQLVLAYHFIDEAIFSALYESDEVKLEQLSRPVWRMIENQGAGFDDCSDLYALMFFCSLRRRAFEEVYMETTDRCPLFLQQHDQAAVFSELWVLGSQCEIYFGIKPRAVGAIIYDEYRAHLHAHPPTAESWNGVDVFTAYHKAKSEDLERQVVIGSDVKANATAPVPLRTRLAKASFLTIFCVPAIVDVGLLTFLGRGLYLTAFMTLEERIMANYAVLASLVMTAGVTGWSGSTGGFYLYQSAFHNMNHFMVQRLAGGFVLAVILAILGFIAFYFQYGWYAGLIFVAYLMVLSSYLNLLGIMATMHRDGAPFKSGRTVLAQCLLITLISPIVSSFVNGHDVLIYLLVLYFFLGVLIFSYSRLCHEWSSWPEKIPIVKEEEILKWFEERESQQNGKDEGLDLSKSKEKGAADASSPANASSKLSSLLGSRKQKPSTDADDFFKKLAIGHPYVKWLLEKESNGQPLPQPYTSTWLVQTKLALTNQQQINRGLKEHSPFLLYRNAKYDLAQNVGLFLVALLDRWIAVSMSANGLVVNIYYNTRARYGVAFGLLYFLLCAVSLDVVLQRYWGKTGKRSSEKLANIFDYESTEAKETAIEKRRWFAAMLELAWVMTFIFGVMTILLWLFILDGNQVLLYFAYIVGYSGVIVFQFNRVFTTNIRRHVQIVFLSAFGGYCLGVVLHEIPATKPFRFNDVIALCSASISAAIGTWLYTDFCDDASQEIHVEDEDLVNWKVYSQKLLGQNNKKCTIKGEELLGLQGMECQFDDDSILSEGIKEVFAKALALRDAPIHATFARAVEMLEFTLRLWKHDQLRLFVVDRTALTEAGGGSVFAASAQVDDTLYVYVGMPSMEAWRNISYGAFETLLIQLGAEAMLHESCEGMMGLRHSDATLAELLLNGDSGISTRMAVQLAWADHAELTEIISKTNAELVRHLAIGIEPNTKWEQVPEDVRLAVVSRVTGRSYPKTEALRDWLEARSDSIQLHDWYVRQSLAVREVAISRLAGQSGSANIERQWNYEEHIWTTNPTSRKKHALGFFTWIFQQVYELLFNFIEFVAIVSTAGTDCGRELWYVLRGQTLQAPILWAVLKIWKVCYWVKNFFIWLLILQLDDTYQRFKHWSGKGASRTLGKGILTISDPRYEKTGFVASVMRGAELVIYEGTHEDFPTKPQKHQVATYDTAMRLTRLANFKAGQIQHPELQQYYEYDPKDCKRKFPISRAIHIDHDEFAAYYDEQGRITHGECLHGAIRFQFIYEYKARPKNSTQILKATYTSKGLPNTLIYTVYWCRPSNKSTDDIQTWTRSGRVSRVIKTSADHVEEITFTYEHKRDPAILRTTYSRAGQQIEQMETIERFPDAQSLIALPTFTSFEDEDLLFYHSKNAIMHAASMSSRARKQSTVSMIRKTSIWARFSRKKKYVPRHLITTAHLRSALWRQWAARTDMSAVVTCLLDEKMLRREPTLKKYWRLRDAGHFLSAKNNLAKHLDEIVAAIELADDAAAKVSLAIRPSDLFVMGTSKDANFVTTEPEETYIDTENRVAVIFTDTGCWPDAPGGVSNCRRDLVDGHSTVRNYALTESANEYGIPRFQIEQNLQLVKNLPLWGLDGKSPCHGLYDNLLQTQVEKRIRRTRKKEDIFGTFVPILTAIVRNARTRTLSPKDLAECTRLFLNLNRYFEENDYLTTWRSKTVRKAWREAWLTEYSDPNISNPNDSFDIERPTASDFDEALELYVSYFFVFSIRVPDEVPRVYQSTHHGISSLYGMILKIRRGTTWGIWDHAIMWRESCLNISPAQCILPIAVQSMLLGAMKLAANLAYTHADIILPCTAIYNPTWESELGTNQGKRGSQKLFSRKIDPITNGISSMDKFKPVEEIRTQEPTAIMLSNVQFIKDVKNAIQAAGVIINDFGFKKYNLIVYGAQDRQPSYAIETEEMINNLGIQSTVKLGGFGSPNEVLKDAWLFMNSSLSEGLPLAIGEAALSGIPIVATEVGATAQVLTDADDPSILYGEVVPPNDPVALARAQISLLAMLGPWAQYTNDKVPPPPLPTTFTPQDVTWITERMYAKGADRRALGLKLREVVLRKFNGTRYLREHEQMYWVQRHMSEQRSNDRLSFLAASHPRFGQPNNPRLVELDDPESMWLEDRWQDFSKPNNARRRELAAQRDYANSIDEEAHMLGGDGDDYDDVHESTWKSKHKR